jgi:hypothetical protein
MADGENEQGGIVIFFTGSGFCTEAGFLPLEFLLSRIPILVNPNDGFLQE